MNGKPMPPHCIECERPLRPCKAKIDHWPGTVLHQGKGLCTGCGKRIRKGLAGDIGKRIDVTEVDHKHNISALEGYLASRRNRLARKKTAA